jgi:hypothetical protein
MRKEETDKEAHSIRTLALYGLLVFLVVLVSFLFRAYSIVQSSKFDGQHRFTLAVGEGTRAYGLLSFEPETASVSLLTFSNGSSIPFSELNRKAGIIPDGYIKTSYPLEMHTTIPSLLQSFIFHNNSIVKNVTIYDLMRFYFFASKIPASTISTQELKLSADAGTFNKEVSLLFKDTFFSQENVSIQIVNAADQSGLGSRLGRVIDNIGGTVVSVKTAVTPEMKSRLQYNGHETYTLEKLHSFLLIRPEVQKAQAVADIVIVIGKDMANTSLF